jgi:hypothetical protein
LDISQGISLAAKELINAMKRTTAGYVDSAKEMQQTYGNTSRGARARTQQAMKAETETVKRTTEAFGRLAETIKAARAEQEHYGRVSNTVTTRMAKLAADLDGKLGDTGADISQLASDLASGNVSVLDSTYGRLNAKVEDLTSAHADAYLQQAKLADSTDRLGRGMDGAVDNFKSATSAFFSYTSAVGNITAGVVRSFDEVRFAMQHQSDLYSIMSGNLDDSAMSLGLAPLEMQKIVTAFRPILTSATGFADLSDKVSATTDMLKKEYNGRESLINSAYKLTGSYDSAANLIMNNMKMLQSLGTAFTPDELGKQTSAMMETMKVFASVTGESSQQQMDMITQHMNSAEVQRELLQLDERTRATRAFDLVQTMKYQVAQRGTVEAALAANKAMSSLSGMSTKDRYKEGVRFQAIAGGMGLNVDPRLANILTKSAGNRTDEEIAVFMKTADDMSRMIATAQQQNDGSAQGMAGAMQAELLFSKIGPELQAAVNELSTIKTQSLKQDISAFDPKTGSVADPKSWVMTGLGGIMQFYDEYVGALVKDPTSQIIAGGVAGAGAMVETMSGIAGDVGQIRLMMAAQGVLGIGGIGGAAKTVVGGITMAGVASVATATAATALAGYGIYQAGQSVMTGRSDIYDIGFDTIFKNIFDKLDVGGNEALVDRLNVQSVQTLELLEETRAQRVAAQESNTIAKQLVMTGETTTKAVKEQTEVSIDIAEAKYDGNNKMIRKNALRNSSRSTKGK